MFFMLPVFWPQYVISEVGLDGRDTYKNRKVIFPREQAR